jgi:ABC-type nitrate/sulfonate/bicarbonate transport system permease component
VGVLDGFRSADPDGINLMRSMGASRWQIFRHVKVPTALPNFFSSLRITVAYAVVGAVLAEWLGGFAGLEVYMTRVKKSFAYDRMFAVIFLISIISLLLIYLVNVIQQRCMPWEQEEEVRRERI